MSGRVLPYVILHHTGHGPEHWDFMLDTGDTLATWQLSENPRSLASDGAGVVPARRIADHRRAYLEKEGPVSRGRGEVRRVDRGTYTLESLEENAWRFVLEGELLTGRFRMDCPDGEEWVLRRLE